MMLQCFYFIVILLIFHSDLPGHGYYAFILVMVFLILLFVYISRSSVLHISTYLGRCIKIAYTLIVKYFLFSVGTNGEGINIICP
jgi:hypothetical protein